MTIREAVLEVARTGDAKLAGAVADTLRRRGLTYKDVVKLVQRIAPGITEGEWETLMYSADTNGGETQ